VKETAMTFRILETDTDGRIMKFSMPRPDNWHAHGRMKEKMPYTLGEIIEVYARATLMPNNGPILRVPYMVDYRQDAVNTIVALGYSREVAEKFALVTMYLHPDLTESDIRDAITHGCIGFKFYPKNPKHGTTGANTDYSVPSLSFLLHQIEWIAKHQGFLLLHGEDATPGERLQKLEEKFIERQLAPLVAQYGSGLNVVAEHATTEAMVDFVKAAPDSVTATITPQHLLFILDSLFEGGLRAKRFCMPTYKEPKDMTALLEAATSGHPKFSAGDDDATHAEHGETGKAKYADCGCAGAHPGRYSLPLYVKAFEAAGALDDRLVDFMCCNGAMARNLPLNTDEIVLERIPYKVPERHDYGHDDRGRSQTVAYLCGGETLEWQVVAGNGPR
jgi:dihydroorotase